jgi:murein L,D-transpeptidase YcbB/YkuD
MSETEGTTTPEQQSIESLPEWARKSLTDANNEAAAARVAKREAVEAARQEVTASLTTDFDTRLAQAQQAHEEVQTELSQTKLAVAKLKAALSVGIPGESAEEFAQRIKGESDEDIAEDAAALKVLFSKSSGKSAPALDPAVDRSQGSGNLPHGLNSDPLLTELKSKLGIR